MQMNHDQRLQAYLPSHVPSAVATVLIITYVEVCVLNDFGESRMSDQGATCVQATTE